MSQLSIWGLLTAALFSFHAWAQVPQTFAVQRRPITLKNEFTAHLSYLPLDNFHVYNAGGLAYTHYFNDYLGWEVANVNFAKASSTGLDSHLKSVGAAPEAQGLDVLQYYAMTNLVYTPFFTKSLFRASEVVWGDLSFVAGGGISKFEKAGSIGTFDFGGAIRFFLAKRSALKIELRAFIYGDAAIKPNAALTLAYAFNFDGEPLMTTSAPLPEDD